jgi:hypothetical protein
MLTATDDSKLLPAKRGAPVHVIVLTLLGLDLLNGWRA